MVTDIINALSKIPNVVWSGLIASLVTLSGVMLSNRSNTKRLIRQLNHDAAQKEKDRFNSLRRDVYLKAVEEASKVGGFFGKIPTLDPATTNIGDGLSEFISAFAKLQLVSQPETTKLAGELMTRYGEILILLLQKATPVHDQNTTIRVSSDFYQKNQSEVDRILAEMKQMNESGHQDEPRFSALQRSFEQSQAMVSHFLDEREKAFELRDEALQQYMEVLLHEMKPTISLQHQLSILIKSELSIQSGTDEIEQSSEKNYMRMTSALERLTNHLKSEKKKWENS